MNPVPLIVALILAGGIGYGLGLILPTNIASVISFLVGIVFGTVGMFMSLND
jgi:hypothetical protein